MVCGNWGDFNAFSTLWLHVPLSTLHETGPWTCTRSRLQRWWFICCRSDHHESMFTIARDERGVCRRRRQLQVLLERQGPLHEYSRAVHARSRNDTLWLRKLPIFTMRTPVWWSQIRPGPESVQICRILDRNGNVPGLPDVTNIVSVNNPSSIPKRLLFANFTSKCMRGMHFEGTRSGRDVCHQSYVRADKRGLRSTTSRAHS